MLLVTSEEMLLGLVTLKKSGNVLIKFLRNHRRSSLSQYMRTARQFRAGNGFFHDTKSVGFAVRRMGIFSAVKG